MGAFKNDLSRFLTGGMDWIEFKDILVTRVCNLLLTNIASEQYSGKLALIIAHGLNEAEVGNVPGLEKRENAAPH